MGILWMKKSRTPGGLVNTIPFPPTCRLSWLLCASPTSPIPHRLGPLTPSLTVLAITEQEQTWLLMMDVWLQSAESLWRLPWSCCGRSGLIWMGRSGAQWRGQVLHRGTGAAVDSRVRGKQHKTDVNQFTNEFHKLDSSWLELCKAISLEGLLASGEASPFPCRHSCCCSFRCYFFLILRMFWTPYFLIAPPWLSVFCSFVGWGGDTH